MLIASQDDNNGRKIGRRNGDDYELEARLLRAIEDLALDEKKVTSRYDIASSLGHREDGFTVQMWLFTLEGNGFIKKVESGYVVTGKGRHKLQNKI